MTEKRFTASDKWIKDNCIGKLLNIDFNTITDANLCCELLNQIETEKKNNGKLASKLLEENEQLKQQVTLVIEDCLTNYNDKEYIIEQLEGLERWLKR